MCGWMKNSNKRPVSLYLSLESIDELHTPRHIAVPIHGMNPSGTTKRQQKAMPPPLHRISLPLTAHPCPRWAK